MGVRNGEKSQCDRTVRKLCNLAAAGVTNHGSCNKVKDNAVLISGVDINTYLQSYNTGYGVDPKDGITTVANAVDTWDSILYCSIYSTNHRPTVHYINRS